MTNNTRTETNFRICVFYTKSLRHSIIICNSAVGHHVTSSYVDKPAAACFNKWQCYSNLLGLTAKNAISIVCSGLTRNVSHHGFPSSISAPDWLRTRK